MEKERQQQQRKEKKEEKNITQWKKKRECMNCVFCAHIYANGQTSEMC